MINKYEICQCDAALIEIGGMNYALLLSYTLKYVKQRLLKLKTISALDVDKQNAERLASVRTLPD